MLGFRKQWWVKLGCVLLVALAGKATIGQSPGVAPASQGATDSAGNLGRIGQTGELTSPVNPSRTQPAGGGGLVASASAEGMIVTATADGLGGQMVTIVDARRNWMVVYGVDGKGQIKLLSSRPLSQDFAVQYNVVEPTPTAISRLTNR